MVQIELSAINGLSCIGIGDAAKINETKEILKRSNQAVASIFLEMIHEDLTQ
jgi:hypothetical protein